MPAVQSQPQRKATLRRIHMEDPKAKKELELARIRAIVERLRLVTSPTRQRILLLLAQGEQHVGRICEELEQSSQPAVSHQLSLLRHGQLIESNRRGRFVHYRLTESGQALAKVFDVLAKSRNLR